MNPQYPAVAERAKNRCEYCHAPGAIFNLSLEVEHVLPVSHGGPNIADNLALACRSCNLYKADHLTGTDPVTEHQHPLFHPRRQYWNRHFLFDAVKNEIHGRTRTGRATVVRLQLNNAFQKAAREQWITLDLFP